MGHRDLASDNLTTAVLLDDHPAVTAGVAAWCATARPQIRLIDAEGQPARVWTGPGWSADVVIFDLLLGAHPPAFYELRRLVEAGRQVVVYSQRTDRDTILTCLDLGAFTYLTKAEGPEHLIPAIRAGAANLPYTSPSLSGAFAADSRGHRPRLSEREREAVLTWFESDSKKLAAARLGVSVKTLETYIDRVRIKYANAGRPARTKAALVERALQDGLMGLDDLDPANRAP